MATRRSARTIFSAIAAMLALVLAVPTAAVEPSRATREGPNRERAVVLLAAEPTATAVGSVQGAEARAYRAELAQDRAAFKDWLARNAPQARVLSEYDTVLNGLSIELRGASAAALANGPGVASVLTPTWMSPSMDRSLESDLVNWQGATGHDPAVPGSAVGQDVFIGIIDTGIDQNHPFFEVSTDAANDDYYRNSDGSCKYVNTDANNETEFTSCKVIIAKVFNTDPTFTAQDFYGHGTHVAGTTAGNSGTLSNTGLMSGVAPAAVLGNYNVFPGTTGSASSDDIALAVDEAVADEMDVLNLSLGGTPEAGYDVLDLALRTAADAGVISAVAAGNSGPGAGTVESPGWAPWVLTAGASTNPHFSGQEVAHAEAQTAGAAVGDFAPFDADAATQTLEPVTAAYVSWDALDGRGIGEACDTRRIDGSAVSGKIALVNRGSCTFTTKLRSAESLGAIGVIVANNVAGDPTAMGHDGTEPFPSIPAVMVSKTYGASLATATDDQITVGGEIVEREGTPDIIAGFSSRGPIATPDGLIVKPDMTAPGVNVNSSVPCSEGGACGFAYFQGTSMATPHLAGSAAAILWNRNWNDVGDFPDVASFNQRDEQVKSLLVNNAEDGVVTDHVTGANLVGVNDEGAGRLELAEAFGEAFHAAPVAFNIGVLDRGVTTGSATVTLSGELGGVTATASTPSLAGVTATASPSGNQVTLTLTAARGVRGDAEGTVTVSNGLGGEIHLVYFARFGR